MYADRADHHPCLRQARPVDATASPKSPIFGDAIGRQPDVARLEVAVDDALGVRELQPPRNLRRDPHRVADRHAPALRGVDQAGQPPPAMYWLTMYGSTPAALLAGIEDRHDVRVVAEPPHRLRLAADARDAVRVQTFRLDRRERDIAVEQASWAR